MNVSTIAKDIPLMDKETFVQTIAPLCRDIVLETFVDQHHREPAPHEMDHLAKQSVNEATLFVGEKLTRLNHAGELIRDLLPQQFSKEIAEQVVGEFKQGAMHLKDLGESLDKPLQQQLKLSTASLNKCFEIGQHLFEEKRFEDAGAVFEMLVILNPHFSVAWLDLGLALHEQEKYEEALSAYAATYLLDPKPFHARAKSVEAYLALKLIPDAEAEYDELEQLVSSDQNEEWKSVLPTLAKKIGALK